MSIASPSSLSSSSSPFQLISRDRVCVTVPLPKPFRFLATVVTTRRHLDLVNVKKQNNSNSTLINSSSSTRSLNSSEQLLIASDDSSSSVPSLLPIDEVYVFVKCHLSNRRSVAQIADLIPASGDSSSNKNTFLQDYGIDNWVPAAWCTKLPSFSSTVLTKLKKQQLGSKRAEPGFETVVQSASSKSDIDFVSDREEEDEDDNNDELNNNNEVGSPSSEDIIPSSSLSSSFPKQAVGKRAAGKRKGKSTSAVPASRKGGKTASSDNNNNNEDEELQGGGDGSAPSSPTSSSSLQLEADLYQADQAAEFPTSLIYLGFEIGNLIPTAWSAVLPTPPPPPSSNLLYSVHLCHRCLTPFTSKSKLSTHFVTCHHTSLPASAIEVFSSPSGNSAIFRVDGALEPEFCLRVAILGRSFISSKDLWDTDVRELEFYLLYATPERLGLSELARQQTVNQTSVVSAAAAAAANSSKNINDDAYSSIPTPVFEAEFDSKWTLTASKRYQHLLMSSAAFSSSGHKDTPRSTLYFAGFFSRVKRTPNQSLCCIMLLPCFQGRGLGTFLVQMAFSLDRVRVTECGCDECCGQNPGHVTEPWSQSGSKVLCSFMKEKLGLGANRILKEQQKKEEQRERKAIQRQEQEIQQSMQQHLGNDVDEGNPFATNNPLVVASSSSPNSSSPSSSFDLSGSAFLPMMKNRRTSSTTFSFGNNPVAFGSSAAEHDQSQHKSTTIMNKTSNSQPGNRSSDAKIAIADSTKSFPSSSSSANNNNSNKISSNLFSNFFEEDNNSNNDRDGKKKRHQHHHGDDKEESKSDLPKRRQRKSNDDDEDETGDITNKLMNTSRTNSDEATRTTTTTASSSSGSTGFSSYPFRSFCGTRHAESWEELAQKLIPSMNSSDAFKLLVADGLIAETTIVKKHSNGLGDDLHHHHHQDIDPHKPGINTAVSARDDHQQAKSLGIVLVPKEIVIKQNEMLERCKLFKPSAIVIKQESSRRRLHVDGTVTRTSKSKERTVTPSSVADFVSEERSALTDPSLTFENYTVDMFH